MPNLFDVKVTWPNKPPRFYHARTSGDDPDQDAVTLSNQYEASNAFPGASSVEITPVVRGAMSGVDQTWIDKFSETIKRATATPGTRSVPTMLTRKTPKAKIMEPVVPASERSTDAPISEPPAGRPVPSPAAPVAPPSDADVIVNPKP